jgi:hypothetical protein
MINTMTKQWMKNVDDQLFIHLLMKISNIEINENGTMKVTTSAKKN